MSYFMSCQKCGKETIGRYATENSLCGECISDIDKLSVEKLQEQLNTAKKGLTEAIEDIEQLNGSDDTIKYYKQALAAIGGDGCPVSPIGVDGLTKYVKPTI